MITAQSLAELRHVHGMTRVTAAFGVFDGVHWGHRVILDHVKRYAEEYRARPVVITFDPHPRAVLSRTPTPPLLTPMPRKLQLLAEAGIHATVLLPFDRHMAFLSAEKFLETHVFTAEGPEVSAICVGASWRFGRRGEGSVADLERRAAQHGSVVDSIPEVVHGGRPISSTRIRSDIQHGRLEQAARLLGRPVSVTGTVVAGRGIGGRRFDCPTANIAHDNAPLPPDGVYAARGRVLRSNELLPGIVYVGTAPTVTGDSDDEAPRVVELHLFDLNRDLYGEWIEVQFLEFIRADMSFPDSDSLKTQIREDIRQARHALQRYPEQ